MGTISDKLTYLIETKSQLKDMINYGLPTENQITNETTFRNYVKSIFEAFIESLRDSTTLYTNLPKISGNGTQITLNDTANAPMRITLNPSALSQDGTPTPDSPQDIHTISGDNSVVVEGKNLVNTSLVYRGFSYNLPVGTTKTATLYTGNLIEIDSNKVIKYLSETYDWNTISVISNPLSQGNYKLNVVREDGSPILTGGTTVYICEKTAQNTYKILNVVNVQQSQQDFWVPTNQNISIARDNLYVVVCFSNNNATINNSYVKFSIQLEKGTTATSYEPYVSQTAPINLPVENLLQNNLTSGTKNGITYIVNEDKSVTLNGTATSLTWIVLNRAFTYEAGDYTISLNPTEIVSGLAIYSDPFGVVGNNRTISITKTTTPDVSLRITSDTTLNNVTVYPQLEKGTKANSYTPYGTTPIEYCKIGDYEDKFIRNSGKNLFNDTLELGSINGSGYNVTSTTDLRNVNYISVKPNTTYTISIPNATRIAIRYYDANKTFLSNGSTNNSPNTFITPDNCYYARFSFLDQTNTSLLVMLNEGTALPYEPYGTNQWYIKKNIGKVVLDGSESYWTDTVSGLPRFGTNVSDLKQFSSRNIDGILSTHFKPSINNEVGVIYSTTSNICLYLTDTTITTVAGFKTWLSTNNTIVMYPLATPTYTQIIGTLETQLENIYKNMLSYKGTTNVSQVNNDLFFNMSVSAIEEL